MPRNPPRPSPAEARIQLDALYAALSRGEIDLAHAVRRMRHISGLTQPEFARHRGISVQALRQIESGRGNPTVKSLNAIAEVFGLQVGFVPIMRA
ncbi:helix-turn-helix domain-containing protein [Alkalisalibacterium limincola]|uniref:Helix-turn-helix transcriptional regulator n=1 Tax=Alkalisalibacterium limincola TaxID=2699169 RepID=A0A5C8KZ51_9GAMM|nr:helix-turn-helix transcriptional regulator [Alkalisalibacterium limincola]TXK64575.1 helix-turn-helix transcriptional regulator [Alkalisalibacterium limincola]